ncbi:class E sortase [Streptomyces sp. NPDC015144]|uniref:class E sortase n=1 Tax=Streptomyces sp. NPDC015144 TaxID=3364944 RepID=UPI0036F9FF5C
MGRRTLKSAGTERTSTIRIGYRRHSAADGPPGISPCVVHDPPRSLGPAKERRPGTGGSDPAHDTGPENKESHARLDRASSLCAFTPQVSEGRRMTGPLPEGGRAARRKAAKRSGRHTAAPSPKRGARRHASPRSRAPLASPAVPPPPMTRVEARRAARARKPGAATVAGRVGGEVLITTGALMLLFTSYQLWWSNVRAHSITGSARHELERSWAHSGGGPDAFEPGQGFAILHIPKLDVVVPIAEGIDKTRVLDRGMVGHYDKDSIPTSMPGAKAGNFGVAGHRNTHGEPFRYINHLRPGDPIVVETRDTYYVYKMASILPRTTPKNIAVLDPVPAGSGFTAPGRYITLTTCTPEFTSTYRMIVWGRLAEERPRAEGEPAEIQER